MSFGRWSRWCTWQRLWKCGLGLCCLGCFEEYHTKAGIGEDYAYVKQKTTRNSMIVCAHDSMQQGKLDRTFKCTKRGSKDLQRQEMIFITLSIMTLSWQCCIIFGGCCLLRKIPASLQFCIQRFMQLNISELTMNLINYIFSFKCDN
jgi:hypothetical protein